MGYFLAHPFAFGPWWLWAATGAAVLAAAIEVAYIRWVFETDAKRTDRAARIHAERLARLGEDTLWQHFRDLEAAQAMLINFGRALDNADARMLDLLGVRDSTTTTKLTAVS